MTIFSDIASNNCVHSDTNKDNLGQLDTDCLSVSEIQKLKKRLEMELAYREVDSLDDDWPEFFDDEDFEADNDNDQGFTVRIDHDFPGQVAAERNCVRFMALMEELVDCEIRKVSTSYDRDGNPVCAVKYWHGGEAEADVVFQINNGLDNAPVRSFASVK